MTSKQLKNAEAFQKAVEHHREGRFQQAGYHCLEILATEPDHADANYLLGIIACQAGEVGKGSRLIRKATRNDPNNFMALNSLGMTLKELGNLEEAVASYRRAISLKPNFVKAYNNLGIALECQGLLKEAVASYRKAISLKPDFAAAYNNLGIALGCQGRMEEAVASYRKAIFLKPDFAAAYNNLGIALEEQGRLEEAAASFREALVCKADYVTAHSNLLFVMNCFPNISQEEIYKESIQWNQQHAADFREKITKLIINREINRRLKVGYVSPDFCRHPVANFFEPLLKAHNRNYVEVYLYANVSNPDIITQRLKRETDHWASILGKSDKEAAEQINADGIDILVDLAGHTANNRLMVFAYKPAPVQITWLGYPNTTGLSAIDYRFTDAIADPLVEEDIFYSEKLIRLGRGLLNYQADDFAPEVSALPCLERGYITFGSFNNLKKMNPEVIKLWARILRSVGDARLLLKNKSFQDKETRDRYLKSFLEEGVAVDRISLYAALPEKRDHLEFYSKIDIGLDTFPYNGTTTTCEALWMGVPVVTMAGDRHAGRVGASILHHAGLDYTLVAADPDTYTELAVNLSKDFGKLTAFRKSLRGKLKASLLCDASAFAKQVEESYLNLWTRYIHDTV